MNDAERFEATRLFIAAVGEARKDKAVPFEPVHFAEAVYTLRLAGNGFAKRFPTFNSLGGLTCPDFQEGMAAAQAAGLITRQNPSFRFFTVRMPPRVVRTTLRGVADEADIRKVAQEYCSRVLG